MTGSSSTTSIFAMASNPDSAGINTNEQLQSFAQFTAGCKHLAEPRKAIPG
ncbi:exported hypothetical protein [Bradyrhizobium sp. STM 3843]|nr:exported hypothetical protein [Bradyrhizobium sp. STM 3843]